MCMRTTPQPASAQTAANSGSELSAVTSLTIAAPASRAAAATTALEVSIETAEPSRASASTTGATRASAPAAGATPPQLLLGSDRRRAGACRLAANVEEIGSLADEFAAMRNRAVGLEELPAVRERVGSHVDDPHDLRVLQVALPTAPESAVRRG